MTVSPQQLAIASGGLYLLYFLLPPTAVPLSTIGIGLGIIFCTILHLCQIIHFFTNRLNLLERLSLAIPSFFIGFPLVLYLLYVATDTLRAGTPIALSGLIFITSIGLGIRMRRSRNQQEYLIIQNTLFLKIFMLFTLLVSILVFWYKPLPDLDPYGWIQTLEPQLQSGQLPAITERPLFAALLYTFTSLLRIDTFTFFKYVFPFLSTAVLVPLWLVIRHAPNALYKILFSLYLLAIPSTALYLTTPTPQAILIILSVYAVAFILYSSTSKSQLYFFAAGAILLSSFFYHQLAVIIFSPWCIITLIAFHKRLFAKWENILIGIALIALLRDQIKIILSFVNYWLAAIYHQLLSSNNLNLLYPAQYINIDQNQLGWPGISGILKFYAYYASPLVLLVVILSLVFFLSTSKKRGWMVRQKEHAVLALGFLVFFSIAEILPRFPNIALLPERAWIFVSIFSVPFFFFLIRVPKTKRLERVVILLTSLCFIVGILGTVHVNSLKKFLITPDQLASAEWIYKNLPKDKVIYGYNNNNLIIFHAKSPYVNFQENILCSDASLENALSYVGEGNKQAKELQRLTEQAFQIRDHVNAFIKTVEESEPADVSKTTQNIEIRKAQELIEKILESPGPSENVDPLAKAKGIPLRGPVAEQPIAATAPKYIYFAPPHPRNPYNSRGYRPRHWGVASCENGEFLFDKYPASFQRIYEKNEIIIWKYIHVH